ncbi:MAG: alpha/beta fold hydrolase [Pseudomonadota bacterium]
MDRASIQTILPLTGPQQAILLHGIKNGHPDPGIVQVQFRIDGSVDDEAMDAAWQAVLIRHDALRTSVHTPSSQKPMMVVRKTAQISMTEQDIATLSAADQQQAIDAWLAQDAQTPLPLDTASLGRVHTFRTSAQARRYVWTTHKILIDGWSAITVLKDVLALYAATRRDVSAALPPVPPLRAYISHLQAQDSAADEAFWAAQFDGFQPTGALFPTDHQGKDAAGALEVPTSLWPRLERRATELGVTPAAFVAAAWGILLGAQSGADDAAFALSLSGRAIDLPGIDAMIGPFAATAPRRVSMRQGSFADAARALHRVNLKAAPHESLPPQRLFGGSEHTRAVPMPETLLTIEALPETDLALDVDGGVALSGFQSGVASGFPVTLVILPGEAAEFRYAFHRVADPAGALEILKGFPTLLETVVAEPETLLSELSKRFSGPARLLAPARTDGPGTAPRTPMELAIAEIWKAVLGIEHVSMDRDFVSHGGRSFASVQVLARIEETFGKRIPIAEFIRAQTVPELAALIAASVEGGSAWRTLIPFRMEGSKPPILFLHFGEHPVTFLKPLADRLGKDRALFAVQPVGVSGDAQPIFSFEALAEIHAEEFLAAAPDGPVHIMGHCGGARLAIELMAQLRARGREIGRFIVIDTHPPFPKSGLGVEGRRKTPSRFRRVKPLFLAQALARKARRVTVERWARWSADLELQRAIHTERMKRACLIADYAYRMDHYAGEVTVVHSKDSAPRTYDWDPVVDSVSHIDMPVMHEEMFFAPDVDVLSATLMELIAAFETDATARQTQEMRARS